MKELKFCIGIDISKDTFHVCVKQLDGEQVSIKATHSFENSHVGFTGFLNWTLTKTKMTNPLFVMEATGIYHEELTHFLYSNGQSVAVVLANKIKHFAKSLNIKTKTDKSDASMIAHYGLERNPQPWQPMIPEIKNLRDLCRERLSLKQDIVRYKCQLHALEHAHGTLDLVLRIKKEQLDFMQSNVKIIENEIKRLTKENTDFNERVKKIETVKGLQLITIVTILCETNGFAQFNNIRQVVSYAGLDVTERQSGLFKGKTKISKKGNSRIRQCLYMPALTATNHNESIKALYQRIVERNPTIKRKGIVAGMRKLLILVFVLWRKNETYKTDYLWNTTKINIGLRGD
jgi:transposase